MAHLRFFLLTTAVQRLERLSLMGVDCFDEIPIFSYTSFDEI